MKKTFIYVALAALLIGCGQQKESKPIADGSLYLVDFEKCLDTERAVKISDIADTVEYIELKSPYDMPIHAVFDIIPIDDYWIVFAGSGVYKFTNRGEYILTFGSRGQGPGQYNTIFDVGVDYHKREVMLNSYGYMLFFDLDGKYLRMKHKNKGEIWWRAAVSDSIFWISESTDHLDKYIAFAMDEQWNVIDSLPNPKYGVKPQDEGTGSALAVRYKPFYYYKDTLYLKGKETTDTIFQLSGRKRKAHVTFDMGRYKLPMEYEAWYNFEAHKQNAFRYWGFPSVAEDDRYLFLFTQRHATISKNRYEPSEDNYRYIVYDKQTREGYVTKSEDGTCYTDDILGGPPIWPYWVIGDYYMNVVSWHNLTETIKEKGYKVHPALQKQLDGWGYDTNPLVIMCRKKNNN